jgi:hypothetical protein
MRIALFDRSRREALLSRTASDAPLGVETRRSNTPHILAHHGWAVRRRAFDVHASLRRVCGRVRTSRGPPLGSLAALYDADPLVRHLALSEREQLKPASDKTSDD